VSPDLRKRVELPATLLICVGGLNVLGALYLFVQAISALLMSTADFQAQLDAQQKQMGGAPPPMSAQELKNLGVAIFAVWGLIDLFGAVLTVVGGLRMRNLQSYGLSVFGAVTAAIPCVSCSGCVGLGAVIGIWALVVLMSADVKAAFHGQAPPPQSPYGPPPGGSGPPQGGHGPQGGYTPPWER
jgi:hypothetical protein